MAYWHPAPEELPLVATRFWPKVQKAAPDECWLWIGARRPEGYGKLGKRVNGKCIIAHAHRVSLQLSGVQVTRKDFVLHSCDNPPCVNPAHLRVGNHRDNVLDRAARQRHTWARGERNGGGGKLRSVDVEQIRELFKARVTHWAIAANYGVSKSLIDKIATGKVWA